MKFSGEEINNNVIELKKKLENINIIKEKKNCC